VKANNLQDGPGQDGWLFKQPRNRSSCALSPSGRSRPPPTAASR